MLTIIGTVSIACRHVAMWLSKLLSCHCVLFWGDTVPRLVERVSVTIRGMEPSRRERLAAAVRVAAEDVRELRAIAKAAANVKRRHRRVEEETNRRRQLLVCLVYLLCGSTDWAMMAARASGVSAHLEALPHQKALPHSNACRSMMPLPCWPERKNSCVSGRRPFQCKSPAVWWLNCACWASSLMPTQGGSP